VRTRKRSDEKARKTVQPAAVVEPATAAVVSDATRNLAALAAALCGSSDGAVLDGEFARQYIERYLPAVILGYLQTRGNSEIAQMLTRFAAHPEFRSLLETDIQETLSPSDEAWWQLRVAMILLRGVNEPQPLKAETPKPKPAAYAELVESEWMPMLECAELLGTTPQTLKRVIDRSGVVDVRRKLGSCCKYVSVAQAREALAQWRER